MATNPKLPDERRFERRDDLKARLRENEPKSGAPWVPIALIVAAALLVALIAFLPRTPKAAPTPAQADVPMQPTGQQIQLSNIKLVPSPDGKAVAVTALLNNAGNTDVTGIAVDGKFAGKDGTVLATIRTNVMGIEGGTAGDTQDLTQAPIKPNDKRPVRMVFDGVPDGWNHEVPALTVALVTGTGNPGSEKGVSPNVKGANVRPQTYPSGTPTTPTPK